MNTFPATHGLAWQHKRSRLRKTLIQPAFIPEFETRLVTPSRRLRFELTYKILRPDTAIATLQTLEGFYEQQGGAGLAFLLDLSTLTKNAADASITGQLLTLDTNGNAPLVRTFGGFDEHVYAISGTPVIKSNGTALIAGTDYQIKNTADSIALSANGIAYDGYTVHFLTSQTGHTLTADFSWRYIVRFEDDELKLEQFHYLLWDCQTVKLITTRG